MNRTEQLITQEQMRQADCFNRIECLRGFAEKIEAVLKEQGDAYWSYWVDAAGIYLGRSFYDAPSIMHDSEIAAKIEELETAFGGEFTSKVDEREGTVVYRLQAPQIRIVLTAYLLEEGTCRKVVTGYKKQTETKYVEVETAVPIYDIACGE